MCSQCTCNGLGLGKDNLLCDASFPLIQLLTDASNHSQTTLQGMGNLLANQLLETRIYIQSERPDSIDWSARWVDTVSNECVDPTYFTISLDLS